MGAPGKSDSFTSRNLNVLRCRVCDWQNRPERSQMFVWKQPTVIRCAERRQDVTLPHHRAEVPPRTPAVC